MESKNNDTNELIYKTETNSQAQRMNLWLPGRKDGGRDNQEVCDQLVHTAIFKMANQQGPAVSHRENSAQCYVAAGWEGSLGEDGHVDIYG